MIAVSITAGTGRRAEFAKVSTSPLRISSGHVVIYLILVAGLGCEPIVPASSLPGKLDLTPGLTEHYSHMLRVSAH